MVGVHFCLRAIKAGIRLGHGLAWIRAHRSIVATQVSADASWKLMELAFEDGEILRSAGPFRGKTAFVMIDDNTAVVSDELEYEGFRQPCLRYARLA